MGILGHQTFLATTADSYKLLFCHTSHVI